LWAESVRRYQERLRRESAVAWFEHEMKMYELHAALSEEHRERAERYRQNGHHGEEST
jgi:hypothetical protein